MHTTRAPKCWSSGWPISEGGRQIPTPGAIRAVVFDLGGTLEDVHYNDEIRLEATRGLQRLLSERGLDPGLASSELQAVVLQGMEAYKDWRERTEIELPPERVWIDYIFPDRGLPPDRLAAAAEDLAFYHENHFFTRVLRPEVPAVLAALRERGLRLSVISNIVSRRLVQHNLAAYGVAHYFDPIVTSASLSIRKPHPRIFLEAARLMDLPPAACAYVGDTVSRDVVGARRAGYGLAIQITSFLTGKSDRETDTEAPDALIRDLREVVDLVTGTREESLRGKPS